MQTKEATPEQCISQYRRQAFVYSLLFEDESFTTSTSYYLRLKSAAGQQLVGTS